MPHLWLFYGGGLLSSYRTWRREGCPPLPHHLVCVEKFTLVLTLPYLTFYGGRVLPSESHSLVRSYKSLPRHNCEAQSACTPGMGRGMGRDYEPGHAAFRAPSQSRIIRRSM